MTKVYVIVPTSLLSKSEPGPYFCYASQLENKSYLSFFQERNEETILDYSPSLPRIERPQDYLKWIDLIKPQYTVLPSIDYSSPKTRELAGWFLSKGKGVNWIGVIQGWNIETLGDCYKFLKGKCKYMALASPLETIASREEIIKDLNIVEKVLYIEVYKNPYSELPPLNSLGIATSLPARLAISLRKLEEYKPVPPPLNFEAKKVEVLEKLLVQNIESYRKVVKNGRD